MKAITSENKDALVALCYMWEQYCPPPFFHKFMTAGEHTEGVLNEFGLLKGDSEINWERFDDHDLS